MERPRLANLARCTVLVCSASRTLFLKVMGHWVHLAVWSTTEMEMLMFWILKGALPPAAAAAASCCGAAGRCGLMTVPR